MPEAAPKLLAEAQLLSKRLIHERSTELPPIKDYSFGKPIYTWRAQSSVQEHPLHKMMSRVGSFPPGLVRYFLALYSRPGDIVLDPFCGKGTALFEASASGRIAIGGDICPDAVASARAKSTPIHTGVIAKYIENVDVARSLDLSEIPYPVRLFYHKETLSQLAAFKEHILSDSGNRSTRDVASFVCGVLLGILHGHSKWSLSLPCNQAFCMSPNYVAKYIKEHRLVRPARNVKKCLLNRALDLLPFPGKMSKAFIVESPAQKCDEYIYKAGGRASLIITSPPYLDKQTYIKDSWLRLWFLNRNRSNILEGSLETSSISTFVEGMAAAIQAMSRSLVKDGTIVMVCGRAMTEIAGDRRSVRISELCLLANSRLGRGQLVPKRLIVDKKIMKRGAYFAVHHGKSIDKNGNHSARYGEDEILILRKE